MKVIHSISSGGFKIKVGSSAKLRCGKSVNVASRSYDYCMMVDATGNQFFGSPRVEAVTCKKCINLQTVGTIHHAKRTAPDAKRSAARAARTHARS
jgi:hypothetical protein